MAVSYEFDPDRVAQLEATGWRAYYEGRWLKLLWLIVRLSQEQLGIPFPMSLLAAYYVTRASIAWVPVDHDPDQVRRYYTRFYKLAARYSRLEFDPEKVGALELRYNDDHRRLVGSPDKSAFVQTLTELHSSVFGLSEAEARESAELRVLANNTVDLISHGQSQDVSGDWLRVESLLRGCYRSIYCQLNGREYLPSAAARLP